MANPTLIESFDINGTNTEVIPTALETDGYAVGQFLESKHLNELFKQLFAAANKNKNDGAWDWEDPTALDATAEYNEGSLIRHNGEFFISLTDLNEIEPVNDGINWKRIITQDVLDEATQSGAKLWQNQAVTITPPTDADYTLTATENAYGRLVLDLSNWTQARNIIVDDTERSFLVDNSAGTYTATVKTSAGTGIPVLAGTKVWLLCDGTNVIESLDGKFVDLVNAQTIAGVKTFTSSPIVPTPTTGTQAVNKLYVDDKYSGFKNYIINGGFDVWQRGTSFSDMPSDTYFADRWRTYTPQGSTNLQRLATGAYADNGLVWNKTPNKPEYIIQLIENLRRFLGKTVTASFWIHNTGTQPITIETGLSYVYDGSANIYEPNNATFEFAPNEYKSVSFTRTLSYSDVYSGKTIGANSALQFIIVQRENSNPDGATIIHNVQLEEGSVATPFEQRPYGLELSLCQRYYEVGRCIQQLGIGTTIGVALTGQVFFKTSKRIFPTVTYLDVSGAQNKVTLLNNSGAETNGVSVIAGNQTNYDMRLTAGTTNTTQNGIAFTYTASAEL